MDDRTDCADVADLLPEVATGAADGPDRARVLRHLGTCDDCRRELDALTRVADEVLLIAPAREAPAGFEGDVLTRLTGRPPAAAPADVASSARPWWRRRAASVVAVAAGVVLAATGGAAAVWMATGEDRDLAASYRDTLDVADGRYFSAAALTGPDGQAGTVFAYDGEPSWLYVVVTDAPPGAYDVEVTVDGQTRRVAECTVAESACHVGVVLDGALADVDDVDLVGPEATLRLDSTSRST